VIEMKSSRLLLSALSLLLALFVYFVPNERFPNSADDWSYLLQARLFASGHAYAQDALYDRAHPLHQYLGTNCATDYQGRRFSKYPPGWPLLLAAGSAAGAEWLVAPLLGAVLVFLVLVDVERRVGSEWVKPAWLLLALCAFFTYTLQSFRSHTATMVCLFGAFLVYDGASVRGATTQSGEMGVGQDPADQTRWRVFASGTLVGYVSLIRYVDWIPLALWIAYDLLRQPPRRRVGAPARRVARLALFAVGFALVASGNLLYDALLSGHPFATPTALNGAAALSLHDQLVVSWRGFVVTGVRLGAVLYGFPPVMVLLARRYWRRSQFKVNAALFLMSAGVYFFYVGAIGGPGPRYLAAYFPFLVVATVDAWRRLYVEDAGRARRFWRYAIVAQILCSIVFAVIETRRVYERNDLARAVGRLAPGRKIVLLKTGPRGETWADFTRNPPALASADVLYFGWGDGDGVGLDRLIERFPDRRVFIYDYPGVIYPRPARPNARAGPVHSQRRAASGSTVPQKRVVRHVESGRDVAPQEFFHARIGLEGGRHVNLPDVRSAVGQQSHQREPLPVLHGGDDGRS
jgi:hypothetical protein